MAAVPTVSSENATSGACSTSNSSASTRPFAASAITCRPGIRDSAMPVPVAVRRAMWPLVAAYLAVAWIAAAIGFFVLRPVLPSALTAAGTRLAAIAGDVVQGTHGLWPVAPVAASVVLSVLSIDIVLFVAVIVFYRAVRPRLAARLAPETA